MKTLHITLLLLASTFSSVQAQQAIESHTTTNTIVFKASIDATDYLVIGNGSIRIEHAAGKLPLHISVNDIKWDPFWGNNKSNHFINFDPPLSSLKSATITIDSFKGRGSAKIIQYPDDYNKFTSVIKITDGHSGAGDVTLSISITPDKAEQGAAANP